MAEFFKIYDNVSERCTANNLETSILSTEKMILNKIHLCVVVLLMIAQVFNIGCNMKMITFGKICQNLKPLCFYYVVKYDFWVVYVAFLCNLVPDFSKFDVDTMILVGFCPVSSAGSIINNWSRGDKKTRKFISVFEQLSSSIILPCIAAVIAVICSDYKAALVKLSLELGFIACFLTIGYFVSKKWPRFAAITSWFLTIIVPIGLLICIPLEYFIYPDVVLSLIKSENLLAVEVGYAAVAFVFTWLISLVFKVDIVKVRNAAITSSLRDFTSLLFVTSTFHMNYVVGVWSLVFHYTIVINLLIILINCAWTVVEYYNKRFKNWLIDENAPEEVVTNEGKHSDWRTPRLSAFLNRTIPGRRASEFPAIVTPRTPTSDRFRSQSLLGNLNHLVNQTPLEHIQNVRASVTSVISNGTAQTLISRWLEEKIKPVDV